MTLGISALGLGEAGTSPTGSGISFDRAVFAGGNVTVTSTTFVTLQAALDLSLPAVEGDVVLAWLSSTWKFENEFGFMDVASMVGGSPVNSWQLDAAWDTSGSGVRAWLGPPNVWSPIGTPVAKEIVAGDIESGSVALRWFVRTNGGANKVIEALSNTPTRTYAMNIGQ